MEFIFILAPIAIFVGGLIWYVKHLEKKRKEAMEQTAAALGLAFLSDGSELQSRFSRFKLFQTGHSKRLYNVIVGDSGEVKISIFDYRFTTGSGKHQSTSIQTVAALQSNELVSCPSFRMRPEGLLDRIGGAMGFQDIDFESHPTFSNMFVLQGEDEEAIRQFFKPALLEFFESKSGHSVEASGDAMFFYKPRKKASPEEIKGLLTQAYEVFGHMVD